MSHSKRNTTRPVFTSYERSLAKSNWTSSSARLNRDSFLPFGSCGLCLEIAREPVACQRGDIFCRECALANLLAQKKELKRTEKARQNAEQETARIRALEDEEERERAIRDFEMTQAGLANDNGNSNSKRAPETTTQQDSNNDSTIRVGTKRKFTLDEDELSRIAKEDKAKARKAIEDEKASKPSLPSFWTPSLTPDVQNSKLPPVTKKGKTVPTCPASTEDNPHPLSLQKLVTILFNEDTETSTSDKRRTCPSCRKVLANSSSPVMAEKCGHVLCLSCVKKFLVPPGKQQDADSEPPVMCFVCDMPVAIKSTKRSDSKDALPVGLVKLRSEGTGFSARGSNTVEKSGVAFQC